MIFNCGPTARERWEQKAARLEKLHNWFAWYPVRVGPRRCAWLCVVQRAGHFNAWTGRWSWSFYEVEP